MQRLPNTRSTVRRVATGFDQAYSVKKRRRRSTTAPPSEAKRSVFLRVEMQPYLKWIYFCASGRRLRGNGVLACDHFKAFASDARDGTPHDRVRQPIHSSEPCA
jgi:hypothetical protein